MDEPQKDPTQTNIVPGPTAIKREAEISGVSESIPQIKPEIEVTEAGVEVVDSPDLPPHEIIRNNVQIPTIPALPQQPLPEPVKEVSKVRILKVDKVHKDPREADAWIEEEELREGMKKAA